MYTEIIESEEVDGAPPKKIKLETQEKQDKGAAATEVLGLMNSASGGEREIKVSGKPRGRAKAANSKRAREHQENRQLLNSLVATTGKMITQVGKVGPGEVITLSALGIAREPPEEVIKSVRALERKYSFGARLRSCQKPDFISLSIMSQKDNSRSVTSAIWDPNIQKLCRACPPL